MFRGIAGAILNAFAYLLHPRVLWLMVWPVLVSLVAWGLVAIFLWTKAALWLGGVLKRWVETAVFFVTIDFSTGSLVAAHVILFLLFVPLVYLTALFILGVFGMDELVDIVGRRRFPALRRREGGTLAGSAWNGVVAVGGMAGLFVLSIPLWVFPPLWPVIPVAVMGWVNQRVLRYDALARHAHPDEMRRIFAARGRSLYALGVVLALLAYVPLVGFLAPVLFGLVFIHFLLAELQALRDAPIEGVVVSKQLEA